MSNLTINHTFGTDGGSKVHIAEHVGRETWITTDLGGESAKEPPQTVVIPWAVWEKFRDGALPKKTKNVTVHKGSEPRGKKKAKK